MAMVDEWLILSRGCQSFMTFLELQRLAGPLASLFLLRDLRGAKALNVACAF